MSLETCGHAARGFGIAPLAALRHNRRQTGVRLGDTYAMNFRRLSIVCPILAVIAASSAVADDVAAPASVKAPGHVARAKNKTRAKSVVPAAGMEAIEFSDPSAPPVGAAKSPKLAVPPDAAGAPAESQGGPSLDLKWHADNDHINNPYWQPWVPNGQGYNVEAGVKLGF